jgi:hypothetical protein
MMTTKIPHLTVRSAILWGLLWVNGPIFPLLLGVPILAFLLAVSWQLPSIFIWISIPLGFLAAWSWWSWTLPKWRLWAISRVDDISHLYRRAIEVGLMWPRGHFFEKTEIKSTIHSIQEREIELVYLLDAAQDELKAMSKAVNATSKELRDCLASPCEFFQRAQAAVNLREAMVSAMNLPDQVSTSAHQENGFVLLLTDYIRLLNKVGTT